MFVVIGKKYLKCSDPVVHFLETFRAASNLEPLLLIELGAISDYTDEMKMALIEVCTVDVLQTVVSLSSGSSIFNSGKSDFEKIMGRLAGCPNIIEFVPFNEAEFQHYKILNAGKYNLEDEVYKSLTNYNPSLLSICSQCNIRHA